MFRINAYMAIHYILIKKRGHGLGMTTWRHVFTGLPTGGSPAALQCYITAYYSHLLISSGVQEAGSPFRCLCHLACIVSWGHISWQPPHQQPPRWRRPVIQLQPQWRSSVCLILFNSRWMITQCSSSHTPVTSLPFSPSLAASTDIEDVLLSPVLTAAPSAPIPPRALWFSPEAMEEQKLIPAHQTTVNTLCTPP